MDLSDNHDSTPTHTSGWMVAAAGMLVIATLSGATYSYGVFLKPLSADFSWSRAAISGVISLQAILMGAVGAVAGAVADRYGYRLVITTGVVLSIIAYLLMAQAASDGSMELWQLYAYLGVIAGAGMGATYSNIMALVARWFGRRGTLPIGIATGGFSLGQIGLPLLSGYLLARDGWFWPFAVLACAIAVIGLPSALVMREDPDRKSTGDTILPGAPPAGHTLSAAVRERTFWYIWVIYLISAVSLQMLIFHIIAYATDLRIAPKAANLILTMMGTGTLVGRLTINRLVARVGLKNTTAFALAVQVPAVFWLLGARDASSFYVLAFVYGFGQGGLSPVVPTLTVDYFGARWAGTLIGFLGFGYAAGSVLGPVTAGAVADATRSYVAAFVLLGVLTTASLALSLALKRPSAMRPAPLVL